MEYPLIKEFFDVDFNYLNEIVKDQLIIPFTAVEPLKDNYFDMILIMGILEHVLEDDAFFLSTIEDIQRFNSGHCYRTKEYR